MRSAGIIFCGIALAAVAYGGFNLWRTAQQLNQASAAFAATANARQSEPGEEHAGGAFEVESLPLELEAPQSADLEDGGFADSSPTESVIEEDAYEAELEPSYADLPDANAEPVFDEAYAEQELEAEAPTDEVFDDSSATDALQALLADPDPEVRDEAARLLQALESESAEAFE
jgi:hypothetical protein